MTEEVLQLLSDDPMVVLNRGYRAKERIAARQKRIEEWRQIAESITANPENASSGGGYRWWPACYYVPLPYATL